MSNSETQSIKLSWPRMQMQMKSDTKKDDEDIADEDTKTSPISPISIIADFADEDTKTSDFVFLYVDCWYHTLQSGWGFNKLVSLSDLNDSSKGFIVNDVLTVQVEIKDVSSTKYANQDRLSPEHQRTIVEMLLPYHPEFEKKIGCGIDYIMVGHHPDFESSRCMFIVRKDGEAWREDD